LKILVTNDDGIYAPGLWAAVEALSEVGEVVVVAPDREQSGVGPSVTLNSPVRVTEIVPSIEGIQTYAIEGTPADSVILALETLIEDVGLVVAGINSGANLGEDVLISGTVGAALQGYTRGIPSLALSVASLRSVSFEAAARIAKALGQQAAHGLLPKHVLLNVNLPPVTPDQINGIEVTRLARRNYADTVRQGDDGKRAYYWITRTRPAWQMEEGTDVWAVRHRKVSITPIQTDLTAATLLPDLAKMRERLLPAMEPAPASR
jgi:5'-nucleotidase